MLQRIHAKIAWIERRVSALRRSRGIAALAQRRIARSIRWMPSAGRPTDSRTEAWLAACGRAPPFRPACRKRDSERDRRDREQPLCNSAAAKLRFGGREGLRRSTLPETRLVISWGEGGADRGRPCAIVTILRTGRRRRRRDRCRRSPWSTSATEGRSAMRASARAARGPCVTIAWRGFPRWQGLSFP